MSGTSTSNFTAGTTVPNQDSWGHYQRFTFSNKDPHIKLQGYSQFVPTSANNSTISLESRNFNYAGFRWHHLTKSTDVNFFGSFTFQSFISDGAGTDIYGFDGTNFNIYFPLNMNNNQINNLAMAGSPAGTDGVNVNYVNSKIAAGTIVLTGNVTGSGVVGTSFATTLNMTLDTIPVPVASVSLNSHKITNLATPTVSTDGTNKAYVDGKTVVLTGNVTGSGTVGVSFATTIVSTLDQIPIATSAVNFNSQNIDSVSNIGIGVASSSTFPMQFANTIAQCKLSLFPGGGTPNIFQTYGFGIQSSTLTYNVASSSAAHVFYCGASSTTSTELFRIAGSGAVTMQGALNLSTHQINGVAMAGSPAGTDAANVTYVNSKIAAGTIVLTGDVTGSGVVGTSFPTTMTLTLDQIPLAAAAVNLNSKNLDSVGNIGIGVASPTYPIHMSGTTAQCKLALFPIGTTGFQCYGFGVLSSQLVYNVFNSGADHVFNCGASTTTSTELFRISGGGYSTVSGGSGTFYSRVPSAQVYFNQNTTTTSCVANTAIKVAGTTTASGNEVQFTTSTTNRLTFSGSDTSQPCVGMASASATIYGTAASQTFALFIMKNGSTQLFPFIRNTSVFVSVAFPVCISITDILVSLSPADYVELWIVCTSTANIKVNDMSLSFKAS